MKRFYFVPIVFMLVSVSPAVARGGIEKTIRSEMRASGAHNSEEAFNSFVEKNGCPIVVENGVGVYEITFLFHDTDESTQSITLSSDTHPELNGTALKKIRGTNVYCTQVEVNTDKKILSYIFEKDGSIMLNDPCNRSMYCDQSKSSLVRLSDSVGALEILKHKSERYPLMKTRDVYVYLPAAYFADDTARFPVLYMFDGQNIWDHRSLPFHGWKVETALETLVQSGEIEPCIVVGISNTFNRTKEYAGWCRSLPEGDVITDSEEFQRYAREHRLMVVEEIIPMIEAKYRTTAERSGRIIAGSSYGAFLAAHFAAEHPDIFCGAGLFSGGSTGFEQIIADDEYDFTSGEKVRFYVDCGTGDSLEQILLPGTKALKSYLIEKGLTEGIDFLYQECLGAVHNEKAWAVRVPDFLRFMLGKTD